MMGFLVGSSFGEQYTYNMTKAETEQFRLSELCYNMQDDLTIEILNDFCKMSYGDLDSMYGEAIKDVPK